MNVGAVKAVASFMLVSLMGPHEEAWQEARQEQNARLVARVQEVHELSDAQTEEVRQIFARSPYMGQGNPAVTEHPVTTEDCTEALETMGVTYRNPRFEAICGGPYMVPLYDPDTQTPEDAEACIDMFEFPDIPCEYPVVWTKAMEAAQMCEAVGKRLCDAHEWEGACSGSLQEPDYFFDLARGVDASAAVSLMRSAHNRKYADQKDWSYGPEYRTGVCATGSAKTPQCDGGSWALCGSNTFPTGMYPGCHSPLGVFDINGNAAEHMNLPLAPDQMASAGSTSLGVTEMKGSWFVFDQIYAHEDWCRWRAPYWHGTRLMSESSHRNYHLGFRCCSTLDDEGP